MLGISGGDPSFSDDDGSVDPDVAAALGRFAAGQGTEHAVLTALAGSRLLVPIVAVLADQMGSEHLTGGPATGGPATAGLSTAGLATDGLAAGEQAGAQHGEEASAMAMPTLIGLDGRRAVPAFTCLESMRRWQADARPVPVAALAVWQTASADSCAVVVDVAGPVPFAVEGARLAALARGDAAPLPFADPDVHEIVAAVLAEHLGVASFELRPGGAEHDLVIALTLASGGPQRDVTDLATEIGSAVMARLGGRLRRGAAIWVGAPSQRRG